MRGQQGAELNFDGTCSECSGEVVVGLSKCRRCLQRHATYERQLDVRRRNSDAYLLVKSNHPRPAWMDDPSLLPKRPPGMAA